ncbi:putative tRNA (guanine(26)-N(2))-dimethyltransferase 2 [Carex littledalei]|uniref:tRNA (guanine(26)-N(2))-dimethyltransferase n=1 Tax=Carex littledalei TaxID=544730 RepID=A0A833R337_9POAL|nr:putative tRNA (guanine(26)-N(2))-dimethyltransferase 2 [Carex littledalei]
MADATEIPEGYTVVKEGEAQILMQTSNTVFFNKAQVNNRDMSIAVLRTFIEKRKEEHEAMLNKRKKKPEQRAVEEDSKVSAISKEERQAEPAMPQQDRVNGEGSKEVDVAVSDGKKTKTSSWKRTGDIQPPVVLEALSASGLRALRYAREVDGIGKVIALDIEEASVEACRKNIEFNGAVASSKVQAHQADARVYMLTHPKEFDVVDIDPYGSPSIFLDSAVQSVSDGGILMCTATDMAVLCGTSAEVCYSKYGSYPVKGKYCHEMALRILLASIESHANRYKRYIVPVLSVHMDFYIRVFVRIFTSAGEIKNAPLKLSYVYQCVGCDSFHLQTLGRVVTKNNSVKHYPGFGPTVPQACADCGKKFNMGGPIWSAPIHDQDWVLSILENVKFMQERYPAYEKILAVLTTISEELDDVPLFVSLHNLCATLKCTSPSAVMFRSAVLNAGYRISGSHVNPLGLKSDAPMEVIWDIMRCWVKNHPIKPQPLDHPGSVILSKEPKLQANFARAVASLSKAQVKKVKRFLPNPEKNWGPKVRAGRQITSKHVSIYGSNVLNGDETGGEPLERNNGEPSAKRQKADNNGATI